MDYFYHYILSFKAVSRFFPHGTDKPYCNIHAIGTNNIILPSQDVSVALEESISSVNPIREDRQSHIWWKFEDYFHMSAQDAIMVCCNFGYL